MMIDLDHFKKYNDSLGHLCGDEVLKHFTASFKDDLIHLEHYLFRFAGDEFVILFPGLTQDEAQVQAETLQRNLKNRLFKFKNQVLSISFSGGISNFPKDSIDSEQLLDKADKALYVSKKRGRDRTTLYRNLRAVDKGEGNLLEMFILGLIFFLVFSVFIFQYKAKIAYLKARCLDEYRSSKTTLKNWASKTEHATSQLPFFSKKKGGPVVIHLKSGRTLTAKKMSEEGPNIRLELSLENGGQGSIAVPKDSIESIEEQTK